MHAQERFFQMDLLRRSTAGELAALIGPRVLALDRAQRPFDYRRRARELLARLPPREQAWLAAYAEGVNAGLADLRSRPPEYWLLGARPDAWTAEDTLLVVLGFYTRLSNNDVYERPQGVLHSALPEPLYEFLTPSTSRFDRPLVGAEGDPTGGLRAGADPGPEIVDLRTRSAASRGTERRVAPPLLVPASNQWALSARRGTRGGALLANDPHLELRLPNVFYRTELEWPDGAVRGVSIPGVPGVLLGANVEPRLGRHREQRRSSGLGRDRHRRRTTRAAISRRRAASRFAARRSRSRSRAATPSSSRSRPRAGGPSSRATGKASRSRCTRPGSTRTGSTSP